MMQNFLTEAATEQYFDPLTNKFFKLELNESSQNINIILPYYAYSNIDKYISILQPLIKKYYPDANFTINLQFAISKHAISNYAPRLGNIKNIIAVMSGKGGVGKSTTAVNLALSLLHESNFSAKIGLLDADIYGPSIPTLLDIQQKPKITERKMMLPIIKYGLQINSIGLLIDNAPAIWRGPMVTGAFNQLLQQTAWDDLDYLIIDMPPGTGDIQLTLAQKVPVTSAIIITTPQKLATIDAQKGLEMLRKVNVNVGGIIENMSHYLCDNCGYKQSIFSGNGAQDLANKYSTKVFGSLPMQSAIASSSDEGVPILISQPDSTISKIYRYIDIKISADISMIKKDTQHFLKVIN